MANTKYVDMLLVEREDGTPAVVIAPISAATEGDIVIFGSGQQATVARSEWIDPETALYAIISAVVPVHEAERIYSHKLKWEKREDDADDT